MLSRILKTGIYFYALLGGRTVTALADDSALALTEPLAQSTADTCPSYEDTSLNRMELDVTPIVDDELMRHHITSRSPEITAKFLALFKHINETHDPHIQAYFNFVFTHLKDFKIAIYSLEELRSISGPIVNGIYQPSIRTMILPESFDPQRSIHHFYGIIRHEIRHAAMHTAHELLSPPEQKRNADFFTPVTTENTKKMTRLFEKGNHKLEALFALLTDEATPNSRISKKDKLYLEKLRQLSTTDYLTHYRHTDSLIWRIEWYNQILAGLKKNTLVSGETINLDFFQTQHNYVPYGSITLTNITVLPKQQKIEAEFIILDPLYSLFNRVVGFNNEIKPHIDVDDQLFEYDAKLMEIMPFALYNYFYPEIINTTINLIEKARSTPTHYSKPQYQHLSFEKFKDLLLDSQFDEVTFKPRKDTPRYMASANHYTNLKRFQDAIKVLDIVARKGDIKFRAEASQKLTRLKAQMPSAKTATPAFFKPEKQRPSAIVTNEAEPEKTHAFKK